MSKQVQGLEEAQAAQARLYEQLDATTGELAKARRRQAEALQELSDAIGRGEAKAASKLEGEITELKRGIETLETREIGLRQACAEGFKRVRSLSAPASRVQVEEAFGTWQKILLIIEEHLAATADALEPIAAAHGFSAFDAAGQPRSFRPQRADVVRWKQQTAELAALLRHEGYSVTAPERPAQRAVDWLDKLFADLGGDVQ
jgi:hypothetical protein